MTLLDLMLATSELGQSFQKPPVQKVIQVSIISTYNKLYLHAGEVFKVPPQY